MCGIAGLVQPGLGEHELASAAKKMAAALRHRGPDDSGIWSNPESGVALGHRRLSIIDLSPSGRQPMRSAHGRYVISYNGEVYNHIELREELISLGCNFVGSSDTEVMLAAFETWGITESLGRFVGMFAFALWDTRERRLILARDRMGIKPLYWGHANGLFVFASELKAIRACPAWHGTIDRNAITGYMRWNYVPSPLSIYENVWKLQPGHLLEIQAGQAPQQLCYWSLRDVAKNGVCNPREMTDDDAADALDAVLGDAVNRRMIADVPLGAFLSGGIDSSVVVALMQAHSRRPVQTFTIGFDVPEYDEANHARNVAQHLGTDHTELYVESGHARDVIPRLPEIYDEPFADSSQIPTSLVSELTRRHVTVALSGDGGDELFAGYTRYEWADLVWRYAGGMPHQARKAIGAAIGIVPGVGWNGLAMLLPGSVRPRRIDERARKLGEFLSQEDADGIYRCQHTHWDKPESVVLNGIEPRDLAWDDTVRVDIPNFVERMQFLDGATYLPDDILTKVDRASMAVGLEARVPILDHRVVDFAWSLPLRFKRRDGRTKWLLRKVLERYLPPSMIERPKMGFSVPVASWLRGPLRGWAEDLLDEDQLRRDGFFNPTPITKTWRRFVTGDSAAHEALWGVLMFQAWFHHGH